MAVKILLFAAFAEYAGKREIQFPYQDGLSCSQIWSHLQSQFPRFSKIPPLFAINEEYVPAQTILKDGDSLMIFPPVSGG